VNEMATSSKKLKIHTELPSKIVNYSLPRATIGIAPPPSSASRRGKAARVQHYQNSIESQCGSARNDSHRDSHPPAQIS
jgi:hypothetical protein